jgi:uncharacterized protein YecE (DUF72 family)
MNPGTRRNFLSGLSGLELPVPKYQFPPEFQKSSRLSYYSTFFNSIEINSSFYKIPMNATVLRWAASVNDDFRFTFKLFKQVTHQKNLVFDNSDIDRFFQTIAHVGHKRACLLVQFPPSLTSENIYQLEGLLHAIQTANAESLWRVAVEFRNRGWYNEEVYVLMESYHASLVIHDIPASATPLTTIPSSFIYVRFHGPTGNYRGSYTEAFLQEYAEYIGAWLDEGKTVYVYFNNTAGDAFNNLVTLNRFMVVR